MCQTVRSYYINKNMSSAEPSTAVGAGGDKGGDGGKDSKSNRAKKVTSTPRQSAQCQLQLKVIRKALERLMQEREQIGDIKKELTQALGDLDNEIWKMRKMEEISNNANDFQHGLPYRTVIEMPKRLEAPPNPATSLVADVVNDMQSEFLQNLLPDEMNSEVAEQPQEIPEIKFNIKSASSYSMSESESP